MGAVIDILRVRNRVKAHKPATWLYALLRGFCGTPYNHIAIRRVLDRPFEYYNGRRYINLPAGTYVSEFLGKGHCLTSWADWLVRSPDRQWDTVQITGTRPDGEVNDWVRYINEVSNGYEYRALLWTIPVATLWHKLRGSYPLGITSRGRFYCSDWAAFLCGQDARGFYPLQFFDAGVRFTPVTGSVGLSS